MSIYYIPYQGRKPAALEINGHRFVILSKDKSLLQDQLNLFGADKVRKVKSDLAMEDDLLMIDRISKNARAGVVFAPDEVKIVDIIRNLEEQLPWLH